MWEGGALRGGETAARAGEKDLAEGGGFQSLRVVVPRVGLELREEAVGCEEQPVQDRGGGLCGGGSRGEGSVVTHYGRKGRGRASESALQRCEASGACGRTKPNAPEERICP